MTIKSIITQLRLLDESSFNNYSIRKIDDYQYSVVMLPPEDSVYHNGIYFINLTFPTSYPFYPPIITFKTKIYHPNVNRNSGRLFLSILGDEWSPAMTIEKLIILIYSLFNSPVECTVDNDIMILYKNEPDEFKRIARDWTKKYAA